METSPFEVSQPLHIGRSVYWEGETPHGGYEDLGFEDKRRIGLRCGLEGDLVALLRVVPFGLHEGRVETTLFVDSVLSPESFPV